MRQNLTPILILSAMLVSDRFSQAGEPPLHGGVAVVDITPSESYPMSGYYHERLSTAIKDPLLAKALVFRQGDLSAALVVCDLIGIAADLTAAVRERAAPLTGIPAGHIVLSATHTHTGPDYAKELFIEVTGRPRPPGLRSREPYTPKLIEAITSAIIQASESARPMSVLSGTPPQKTPVAFNRRFLMKDGTVRTWATLNDPQVVRPAGPIDPEIGVVLFRDAVYQAPVAVLSSFALHLDTVGGTEWSADYPFFIDRTIKKHLGGEVVSVFGTGCCGNINHVDPMKSERNKTDFIGTTLGTTICEAIPALVPLDHPRLQVHRTVVAAPLQESTPEQLASAKRLLREIQKGQKADFYAHVDAYKRVILDGLRNRTDPDEMMSLIGWGLSSSLSGSGEYLPLEVQVITLGRDVAIVALPGEVFVELGLAIKNASPFPTTLVVELSNCVETIYIPHRYAFVGGGYEVVNSVLQPGGGELLADAAIRLLARAAAQFIPQEE